jgi:hypothetical protein
MLFRAIFLAIASAVAIVAAAIGLASPGHSSPGRGCYMTSPGSCVPYPQQGAPQPPNASPGLAAFGCRDGGPCVLKSLTQ